MVRYRLRCIVLLVVKILTVSLAFPGPVPSIRRRKLVEKHGSTTGLLLASSRDGGGLPLDNYKKVAVSMLDVLEETKEYVTKLETLAGHLELYHSMDPDIVEEEEDREEGILQEHDGTATATRTTVMDHLERAAEYARIMSDKFGRTSLEAEVAWKQVTHIIEELPESERKNSKAAAILLHPAYRYNYAQAAATKRLRRRRRQQQQQKATTTTKTTGHSSVLLKKLLHESQKVLQSLQTSQDVLRSEQQRLKEKEEGRTKTLERLWKKIQ